MLWQKDKNTKASSIFQQPTINMNLLQIFLKEWKNVLKNFVSASEMLGVKPSDAGMVKR